MLDGVPPELRDADHPLWCDQACYRAWMSGRRWSLPPSERLDVPAFPAKRRQTAASAWALTSGVACGRTYGDGKHPHVDWHRLRELGLYG
ncbi:MAG: hypothetical protein ACRDUV_22110 [Pseudonocardiaceae bacterium]